MSLWDDLNKGLFWRSGGIYSLKLIIYVKVLSRFDFMWRVYLWQIYNVFTRTRDNICKKSVSVGEISK